MGKQSKLTASRRRLDQERRERNAKMAFDPHWQEVAASFWDEECAKLCERDAHAQRGRLADDGWTHRERNNDGIGTWDHAGRGLRIIHSLAREKDEQVWGHVSVSRRSKSFPTWEQVRDAGWLLYPERFGIIVAAPKTAHVNLAEVAHVWFCLTAKSCPDFSHGLGSI